jgi:outer membrane protein assembly factor BamB
MVDGLGIASTKVRSATVAARSLLMDLVIGHGGLRMNRNMVPSLATSYPLRLDLTVADDAVRGAFTGTWRKNHKSLDSVDVQGKIAGVVVDAQANALPRDAVWPCYVGPNQSFSSGPCARPLVDSLDQARLLWVSEYIGPTEAGSHRYGSCAGVPSGAGGASPLVAHGRVYQFRYQASGKVTQTPHIERVLSGEHAERTRQKLADYGWTKDDLIARWRIEADEELLCIDAATGRTLWRAQWPGEGLHYFDHKCSLTNWTGAVAGDRVCVLGGMGRLRAVDAQTGRELWAISVPGLTEQLTKLKERALKDKLFRAPSRSFCHALAVTEDLVLAPDSLDSCGIVAVELATGNVRWHAEGRLLPKETACPLVVRLPDGPTLALAVGDSRVTAIDCATGKTAWESDAVGWNAYQCVLAGDRLIAQAMKRAALEEEAERFPREKIQEWAPDAVLSAPGRDHGQIGCWRVTVSGLEKLWVTPPEWGATANTPVGAVLGEHLCFRGKFAYQIVDLKDGARLARSYLPTPARMDEGHMLALPGLFVPHPDSQHGQTKLFLFPDRRGAKVGAMWQPPHPHATTYQAAMSHAWTDGRLFIRGADALYCYDLRVRTER